MDRFVVAAYGLTVFVLAGYAVSVLLRRRSTERQIEAMSGPESAPEEANPERR